MITAIVGANWGDEGKGKITDLLAKESEIVIRFQGGSNAGHTIVNDYGKFALHMLPSGVFYGHTTNIIGNGVALNIPYLINELQNLTEGGVFPEEPGIRPGPRGDALSHSFRRIRGRTPCRQILRLHQVGHCALLLGQIRQDRFSGVRSF